MCMQVLLIQGPQDEHMDAFLTVSDLKVKPEE